MFTETRIGDSTALARQNRRIRRLKAQGVTRSTVLVHDACKDAFLGLKPHLASAARAEVLNQLVLRIQDIHKPTNVAQVRQLSPFRYPGGKTWLIPEVRSWLAASEHTPAVFVEPFAGGAMAGLTAAAEMLADRVVLCELDDDVAAVWETIFDGRDSDIKWLCDRIHTFDVRLESVRFVLSDSPTSARDRAFRTIIKNRMQRGGIMAPGAGLVREGEGGRGLKSRWYPATLVRRIEALRTLRRHISFVHGDAFEVISDFAHDSGAFFFVDPPYTAGGKKAGTRLYTHSQINHERLFALLSSVRGSVMMTYDDSQEVRQLATAYGFRIETVPMKNTHHAIIRELLILKP